MGTIKAQQRQWIRYSDDKYQGLDRLVSFCGVKPVIAQVLVNRGVGDIFSAPRFLDPHFAALPDRFDGAVATVARAIKDGRTVFIHGDYDVDGITSTAMLQSTIELLGGKAVHFIPSRQQGYGLRTYGVEQAKEAGASVMVTVDCGTNSVGEINLASTYGMTTVVIDHHKIDSMDNTLAATSDIVSSELFEEKDYLRHLSGAGLTFLFCIRLAEGFGITAAEDVFENTIELATLGTLADMVPLLGFNRWIVKSGIARMRETPSVAMGALVSAANLEPSKIDSMRLPFAVTPMINAAGRISDASIPMCLFRSETKDEAEQFASQLLAMNKRRQVMQAEAFELAKGEAAKRITESVVIRGNFPQGIAGLVASNLCEQFGVPAIVLSQKDGDGKLLSGSARSSTGIDIYKLLTECRTSLVEFGGHDLAAGMTLESENFESFVSRFDEHYKRMLETTEVPLSASMIDATLTAGDITYQMIDDLKALEPFGFDAGRPVFLLRNVSVSNARQVGEGHLKCNVTAANSTFDAIGFGLYHGDTFGSDKYDLLMMPEVNVWRDRSTIQLVLKDIREAENRCIYIKTDQGIVLEHNGVPKIDSSKEKVASDSKAWKKPSSEKEKIIDLF